MWCESGTGNTQSGCTNTTTAPARGGTYTEAMQAIIDRKFAAENAAFPSFPRVKDGAINYSDVGGGVVNGTQNGHWMNGAAQTGVTWTGTVMPLCPIVNGTRAVATRVAAFVYTCPGTPPPGSCEANQGQKASANFTVGWSRSVPTKDGSMDLIAPLAPPSGSQCVNGCTATVLGASASFMHGSLVPSAQGLYRISGDYWVTTGPNTCSVPATAPNNPQAPNGTCDGFVGQVMGVTRCIAPVGGGAASAPMPSGSSGNGAGNPAAGSDGAKPVTDPARNTPGGVGGNTGGPPSAGSGGGLPGAGTPAAGGASPSGSPSTGTSGENSDGGPCQINPSASGCGGSPAAQPTLYTKKTKTFGDALSNFSNTLNNSAIGSGVRNFFTLNLNAGGCPTWTLTIDYLQSSTLIDMLCTSTAQALFLALRGVLLVVAGWAAFRIAFF